MPGAVPSRATRGAAAFEQLEPRMLLDATQSLSGLSGPGEALGAGSTIGIYSAFPDTQAGGYLPVVGDPAGGPIDGSSQAWSGYDMPKGGDASGGTQKIISGVPAYIWRYGCGPTAAGMVIGYWDMHGYANLVPGDSSTQTADVNAMIASDEHYQDYSLPIDNAGTGILTDKSELGGAHSNNSVADWMCTSWSLYSLYYGWTYFTAVDYAIDSYTEWKGYSGFTTHNEIWGAFTWDDLVAEMDNNRPLVLLVDSDADGVSDHFVPAIGYDTASHQYAAYNTWDTSVHWYNFAQIAAGQPFSIYGATFTDPPASTNHAPVLSGANDLAGINEDAVGDNGTRVSDLIAGKVTDADAGALEGIAVTAVDNAHGAWQYSTDGGSSWTAFGSPSGSVARLLGADANSRVRFVPNGNWNGTVSSGSRSGPGTRPAGPPD